MINLFIIGGAFLFGLFAGVVFMRYLNNLDFRPEDPIEIRRRHREAFLKQHREMTGE